MARYMAIFLLAVALIVGISAAQHSWCGNAVAAHQIPLLCAGTSLRRDDLSSLWKRL